MMPVMGNLTLVIAVLSYAGQLNLTATADHDHCPDLEVFAEGIRRGLDHLTRSTPKRGTFAGHRRPPDEPAADQRLSRQAADRG